MGLIMNDFTQWLCEHCTTKEDLQFYKNKIQELENSWEDEVEETELKTYCVHLGYRYTTDVIVKATDKDTAIELAENYIEDIPISDKRFCCCSGDADAWEEEYDDEDVEVVEEEDE